MQVEVKTLANDVAGTVDLADEVFGLEVRKDILHRVVTWQLAKRQTGNHKAKGRAEVTGTTQKMYRQKGTGRARHGSKKAPQFRKGGVVFGPQVRSHAHDLPKKIRRLGLKTALSAKAQDGKLIVLDSLAMESAKTRDAAMSLKTLGLSNVLFIDGPEPDINFARATRNIIGVQILPEQGANVYDILRRDVLVLSRAALQYLEERLK